MSDEIATLHDVIATLEGRGQQLAILAMQTEGMDEWTSARLADHRRRLAAGLRQSGLEPGARAALVAPNRPEWIIACLALIEAGGVPVLIDAQTGPEALARVIDDSGASWVFSTSGIAKPDESGQTFPAPFADRHLVLLDAGEDQPRSWRRLLVDEPFESEAVDPEELAVLFYTSGTSGAAKGVPLSHRNLASNVQALKSMDLVAPNDRLLLPLPLHHVYPFSVGMLLPLVTGIPIILPQSLTGPELVRAMKEGEATDLLAVPRLLSALMAAIEGRVADRGRMAVTLFHAMLATSTTLRWRLGLPVGRWLFTKLHQQMAPSLHTVASGGSAIDAQLARRLEGLGWRFADGYGLTETSPLVAFNLPGRARIGTVGRPVDGVDVRIAEPREGQSHGEIEVKGPNVFSGYWNRPEETEAAFTSDGYFRTGDLGELDRDGYLRVFGRASSLIVMPGGENVWPEDVEQALVGSDMIAEAGVLLREERLVAVVVPESEPFRNVGREEVESDVRAEVKRIARTLPSHHRVGHVQVTRQPLNRTRLGKLRRHLLEQRYEELERHGDRAEQPGGPVPVEEMPEEIRSLFQSSAVRRTWDWLAERYSDVRLAPETHLQADLGIDSMEWLRLGLEIQQRTGHALPEETIRRIETVGDLLREVAEAQQHGPSEVEDLSRRLREPEEADRRPAARLAPHARRRGEGVRSRMLGLARLLLRGWFRLRVLGQEHVSGGQPVIVLPNHRSYLDAPAVGAALPREQLQQSTWGGATSVMFRNRFMRLLSRATRVIPVDPRRGSGASLALAAAALKRGDSLVWFPEGGISRTGRLQPFLPGIGLLLEAQPLPVVPVWVAGSREALPFGSWRPRFQRVTVRFGEPIAPDDIPREGDTEVERAQNVAEFLHDRVAELGKSTEP
jgi:long-chain acyl-CoA synthetase